MGEVVEVEENTGCKDEDGDESGYAARGFMFVNLNLMEQAGDLVAASCAGARRPHSPGRDGPC